MDGDTNPQPAELWVPPSYRARSAEGTRTGVPRRVRYRRTLLRIPVLVPVLVIAGLWLLVTLDAPEKRAETAMFCGPMLALVLAALIGTHWPAVETTESHLAWVALPWPGDVPWANIRSAQLLGGVVGTQRRVRVQWMTFMVRDPVRDRVVSRNLSLAGLPRRELLEQCADNAAASNPDLAASLRQTAKLFGPTRRCQAFGSSSVVYGCATVIGVASAAAALLAVF